ncbi:MAG TPA: hypothetical protein VK501_08205 [Baekduia sp.]|uniref:hypothetical protein n=1 Tax=Baekduia sp. TaxID=2600305 RepID=UPI002C18EB5C|nr:hypothetical protein [Baekduia sp.]HMJ33885.1 hypothetical protein [Baekduia sp.]
MRIGAARRQDLPMLIEFVASAEQACMTRLQGLRMPDVESLVARGAPWEAVTAVLLGKTEAADVAGRSKVLRNLRLTLEALQRHHAVQDC